MHDANDNWPNACAHHASHSQCTFRYAERQPDPTLTPWIAAYWEFCALLGAASVHHVPPDGCTSLLVPTSGPHAGMMLFSGPWLEPLAVPVSPGSRFVGVRLRPGAAGIVLDMSVATLCNASMPAAFVNFGDSALNRVAGEGAGRSN